MKITSRNRIFNENYLPLRETINVANEMHSLYLTKLKFVNFNSQMELNFNRFSINPNQAIFICSYLLNFSSYLTITLALKSLSLVFRIVKELFLHVKYPISAR